MDLSIIILNYKTRGLLKNCLRGISKYPLKINYEIIVVDNDSRDGSVEMLKQDFPEIKLILSPKNVGHAAGNNLGLKEARGRYVLLLNPDIAVMDNAIEKMVEFMDENPKIAAAGPKLINPDGTVQMNCRKFPSLMVPLYSRTKLGGFSAARKVMDNYLMSNFDHNTSVAVDWIFAACLIVRRRAIDQVGLLDDNFFLYFADVDWCRQFWRSGWEVFYLNQAQIIHFHNRESAENHGLLSLFNPKTRIHIRDWFKYLKKYGTDTARFT